ncbi:hypothetical protein M2140_000083 [Clostridiales Family XIII bacterium PM5-7]
MVYIISKDGEPLMPTKRQGKVRRLLKNKKAKVISRCPFTIQLLYETTTIVQEVILGVDAGSKVVGLSATTEKEELYASETQLRTDIVGLLASRREQRRGRRHRKTRYRAARFSNRKRDKGWLAPSIKQKIASHEKLIKELHKLLPVAKVIVETASFDTQKLKDSLIAGEAYQQGEQLGFWNVREYVLFRDNHVCQHCKDKSKDAVLNVHHIESRKTGGDAPTNLITLCETCHNAYHRGKIDLKVKRGASYKDAAFMGIMRWALYEHLKEMYQNVEMTFGYITKHVRIGAGLEKTHAVDARCISGNPKAVPLGYYFHQKCVRRHNRQLHKATINKGGIRKRNQAPKYVFGYQLFDQVKCGKQEGFVFGRRSSGSFDIRQLDGTSISKGVSYKKLKQLQKRKTILTERRMATSSPQLKQGVSVA